MNQTKHLSARALPAAAFVCLILCFGAGARSAEPPAAAKKAPAAAQTAAAPSVIATVGSRKIDSVDIQRAAASMASDPLRKKDPASWRRMLLDRCVDRELLAMEAERQGLDQDPELKKRIAEREYLVLLREMYAKVLVPNLTPTPDQLRDLRAGKLYRGVDLYYILLRDNASGQYRALALRVLAHAQAGARFDSLAKIYSGHPPSQAAGGHFGWVLARDLDPRSYDDVRKAKVGDVVGVYSGPYGHEIYKIGAFQELSDDSLYNLVYFERKKGIANDYEKSLLTKYHFALDSTQVKSVAFATGTEAPDSILEVARSRRNAREERRSPGHRDSRDVRRRLGHVPRAASSHVSGSWGERPAEDSQRRRPLPSQRARGASRPDGSRRAGAGFGPESGCRARAAVEPGRNSDIGARGAESPGPSRRRRDLRKIIDAHPERYWKPRISVAQVAIFASRDTAEQALKDWAGKEMTDTLLAARQLLPQPNATERTLLPGRHATLAIAEESADSLARAIRAVLAGGFAPVVRTEQGWAVAQVFRDEESRPMTFEEARFLALREWRDQSETKWAEQELAKLRLATPVKVTPGRLEAVNVAQAGASSKTKPGSPGKVTP